MRKAVIGFFILALLTGAYPLLGQKVSLNFDEVDIAVFLQTMSEITGKSFVVSDKVKGKISFVSSEDVPASKVYPIVLSILEARGFQAVPGKGDIIHIYPAQEALKMSGRIHYGTQPHPPGDEGIITHIIPLDYADVNSVINAIRPAFGNDIILTPYTRINSIITSGNPETINLILDMVGYMDTSVPTEKSDIHIYNLENSDAVTMAKTLSTLASSIQSRQSQKKQKTPEQEEDFLSDRFNVVANEETNSVIIISAPDDWEKIENIIVELDIKRDQVLVEALILEITLNDDQILGFDWNVLVDTGVGADVVAGSNTGLMAEGLQTGGLAGLTVGLLSGDLPNVYAILNANKEKTNLKILSTPEIVTVDNHEATIEIGEQIPFLTSSRVDENNNVVQTYDYKNIGITLKLTPHINKNGYITMNINQQIKKIVEGTRALENPSVFNREVTSKVTVRNERTIVIGGLIRDDITTSEQKVPILGDIPILGLLFRKEVEQRTRTNLLIFITPHLITDDTQISEITEQKRRQQEDFEATQQKKKLLRRKEDEKDGD